MVVQFKSASAAIARPHGVRPIDLSHSQIDHWMQLGSTWLRQRVAQRHRLTVALSTSGLDSALDGAAARHAAMARGCTAADVIDRLVAEQSMLRRR